MKVGWILFGRRACRDVKLNPAVAAQKGFYVKGTFKFTFKLNANYPHEPPKVLCRQKIYHPNIDLEGNVCLNILREDWKPVLNLNSILVGLQYLFLEPNADDPLNKGTTYFFLCKKSRGIAKPINSRCGRPSGEQEFLCEQRAAGNEGLISWRHDI